MYMCVALDQDFAYPYTPDCDIDTGLLYIEFLLKATPTSEGALTYMHAIGHDPLTADNKLWFGIPL